MIWNGGKSKRVSGVAIVRLTSEEAAQRLLELLESPFEELLEDFEKVREWYDKLSDDVLLNTSFEIGIYHKVKENNSHTEPKLGDKLRKLAENFLRRSEGKQNDGYWEVVIRDDVSFEPEWIGLLLAQFMKDYQDQFVNPGFLAFTSVHLESVGTEAIPPYGKTTIVTPGWTDTWSDLGVCDMDGKQFTQKLESQLELLKLSRSLEWVQTATI